LEVLLIFSLHSLEKSRSKTKVAQEIDVIPKERIDARIQKTKIVNLLN
jgi:hypothetical protein